MDKRYLMIMSVWVGLIVGLYCMLYQFIPFPAKNLLWITFVSLPIYFGAGAKLQEFPHYFCSMFAGVFWAFIYLGGISWFIKIGISVPFTMLIIVGLVTAVLCAVHLLVTPNTWLNKLPIIFGTVATLFYTNGQELLTVIATLTGGLVLGLLCTLGTNMLSKVLIIEKE